MKIVKGIIRTFKLLDSEIKKNEEAGKYKKVNLIFRTQQRFGLVKKSEIKAFKNKEDKVI